jgi:hypothetical protein
LLIALFPDLSARRSLSSPKQAYKSTDFASSEHASHGNPYRERRFSALLSKKKIACHDMGMKRETGRDFCR